MINIKLNKYINLVIKSKSNNRNCKKQTNNNNKKTKNYTGGRHREHTNHKNDKTIIMVKTHYNKKYCIALIEQTKIDQLTSSNRRVTASMSL